MASLAGMLKTQGHEVSGSDQDVYPPMSTQLEAMKIPIFTPYAAANLRTNPDLVVVGNAISRGNAEAEAMLEKNIPYLSMPQALAKFFFPGRRCLVVAGTHGKTTTAAMLAWVLESAGKSPSYFIGGIPRNFGENFKLGKGPFFVLEGDEYDTAFFDKGPKFLHYQPEHVMLTSIEFDHADIYRDLPHVVDSFRKLLKLIPRSGSLVANLDFPEVRTLLSEYSGNLISYAMREEYRAKADFFGEVLDGGERLSFCILSKEEGHDGCHHEISWGVPGSHNVSNALGVVALALRLGLSWKDVQKGLVSFQGVRRRQEELGEVSGVLVIDDFAHHPTAVLETIRAIRNQYPSRRLWAIYEPRSNTSKRDIFQKQYPDSFREADRVILADVFMPERVKNGQILNVEGIVDQINRNGKGVRSRHLSGVDSIVDALVRESQPGDVILFMSNGGFGGVQQKTLTALEKR